jgi:hypothetical protein
LRRGTTDRRQPRDAGIRGMTSGSSTVAGLTTSAPGWTKCALPTFKSIKKRRASVARSSLTSRCICLNRLSKNRCLFDISIRVRKITNPPRFAHDHGSAGRGPQRRKRPGPALLRQGLPFSLGPVSAPDRFSSRERRWTGRLPPYRARSAPPSRTAAVHHATPFFPKLSGNSFNGAIAIVARAATASALRPACQAGQQRECSQTWPSGSVP